MASAIRKPRTMSVAINAPNSATPTAPPVCRTALSAPEATPDRADWTADNTPVVIAGTTKPMPSLMISWPGRIAK